MVRHCVVLIIGFIACIIVFSGCATEYATKSSTESLEVKVALVESDLKETSAQIRDEVKALHARIEGSYQGSIEALAEMNAEVNKGSKTASEALAQAKVAEQLGCKVRDDTDRSLAMMEEKVRSASLDKKELMQLRRDLDTVRAEYETRTRNPALSSPLDFYEGKIAYRVGVEDDLTLSVLANHCKFPLRRLMALNYFDHDVPLSAGDIVVFGAVESQSQMDLSQRHQLHGRFGCLKFDTYQIRPGDYLSRISSKLHVSLMSLVRFNRIECMDVIKSGSFLMIPRITDTH